MIFIASLLSLSCFHRRLLPSLSFLPPFSCCDVLLCLPFPPLSHPLKQYRVQGLGSFDPMSGVTSTAALSHASSRSTTSHWTNSPRWSRNKDPLARKLSCDPIRAVLRARSRSSGTPEWLRSKCKCLHEHAFCWLVRRVSENNIKSLNVKRFGACHAEITGAD